MLCNAAGISHHFESQEIEVVPHSSHLPLQPELVRIFNNCHKRSSTFDLCIRNAFNELRVYFKTGEFLFHSLLIFGLYFREDKIRET